MMYCARSFLGQALVLSLILHAAAIAVGARFATPTLRTVRPARPDLMVWLRDQVVVPEAPAPAPPRLLLPEGSSPHAISVAPRSQRNAPAAHATPAPAHRTSPARLSGEAALRAAEQLARDLPYPPEAIERGLQGEALVMLFLDPAGNVIAARLESSSGHALLDDAAVRAARGLRSLPDSAPREALLPVRFRLR